jgi:hypothetical protein
MVRNRFGWPLFFCKPWPVLELPRPLRRSSLPPRKSREWQDPLPCPVFLIFHFLICLCDLLASATFSLVQGTVTIYCPYLQIKLVARFYAYVANGLSRSFGSILPLPK